MERQEEFRLLGHDSSSGDANGEKKRAEATQFKARQGNVIFNSRTLAWGLGMRTKAFEGDLRAQHPQGNHRTGGLGMDVRPLSGFQRTASGVSVPIAKSWIGK